MTDEQKIQVVKMRTAGDGYRTIAQAVGVSANTVKSYCQRNNLGVAINQEITGDESAYCECCGIRIEKKPGQIKRFCSDACRRSWWSKHPEQIKQKAVYKFTCVRCGKEFTAYGNNHRKYCSHECYIRDRFGGGRDE